jgi:hypothetical protein
MKSAIWLCLLLPASCFSQTGSGDYPPEQENVIQKIKPGKQLFKEDEPCGEYFWKSLKADRSGAVALYYFFGSTEYGKGKLGLYQQVYYRVETDGKKDPPTAQVIKTAGGIVKEVLIRMTGRELEASRACFAKSPEK